MATETLDVIDAEFTAEEEEALDTETAITPYERLETWQGILSDPAKAIQAFGGIAIDALAIQFDDGRGRKHFALTAEGAKAVLAKSERPYRIHKPEFEEFTIDGAPWVRCIATVTLLDNGTEVADISERPRKSDYGKLDKFAGRSAFTSALARVARTICAGTVGMLEAFFTTCMNEGKVIVPGEAPDAIRTEVKRAQAGRAEERMGDTPRIGKEKGIEFQSRLRVIYNSDKARFANIARECEAVKTRLCRAALKFEAIPVSVLPAIEAWFLQKEEEAGLTIQGADAEPMQEPIAQPVDEGAEGEEPPEEEAIPGEDEFPEDFGLSGALAAAREKGMSEEDIFAAKNQAGLLKGVTAEGVKAFSKLVAAHRKKTS